MRYFLSFIVLSAMIISAGCTGISSKPTINLGIIENTTKNSLHDVSIRQLPTNSLVKTSTILPLQTTELGLPTSKVLADFSVVSWIEEGRAYQVKLATPRTQSGDHPLHVLIFRIYSGGQATISLE